MPRDKGQQCRLRPDAVLGVMLAFLTSTAAAAGAHPWLADAPENARWHAPAASHEAVLLGVRSPEDPAVLVLRKSVIARGAASFALATDAKAVVLRTGNATLEIPLQGEPRHHLVLDASELSAAVTLDDRELTPLRGRWIDMALKQQDEQIAIELRGCTYATVRWSSSQPQVRVLDRQAPLAEAAVGKPESAPAADAPVTAGPAVVTRQSVEPRRTHLQTPLPARDAEPLVPENLWDFNLSAGINFPTAYFFRGFGRENQDLIVQPWAEADLAMYRGDGSDLPWINGIGVEFGFLSSHFRGPAGLEGPFKESWTEFNWHAGVYTEVWDDWRFSLNYRNIESIRTNFRDVHEFDFRVAFDDSDPQYPWSLQPYALVAVEIENESDGGWLSQGNADSKLFSRGFYLELGVRPTFELARWHPLDPVTLTVPAKVGLNLSNYYEDPTGKNDIFGYFETGLDLKLPVFVFRAAGDHRVVWHLDAGVHLIALGDAAADLSRAIGTGSDDVQFIGTVGIGFDY